jgi:hypothetical protein
MKGRRQFFMVGVVATVCAAVRCAFAGTPPQQPAAEEPSARAPAAEEPIATQATPAAANATPPNPNSGCSDDPTQPLRRRPGHTGRDHDEPDCDPNRLPTPDTVALPAPSAQDRWRIVDKVGAPATLINPYATNNLLKGDRPLLDRPLFGGNWFFDGTATSNTLLESRRIPVAAGIATPSLSPREQQFDSQTTSIDAVLYRGDTIFAPPDFQFRFTPIFNYSATHTDGADVSSNTFGAQALFIETHLRETSENYDFDSLRVGIQAVNSDFRGFVLADQPVGIRLFGTRDNDIYQYNIGWFRPLPKNAARQDEFGAGLPANDIFLANLYIQDLFKPGLTSEVLFMYDRNRARGTEIIASAEPDDGAAMFVDGAPHSYDVGYFGYSVDGHLGKWNLTGSLYEVLGLEEASEFGGRHTRVAANFAAAELSRDFDWIRVRASGLYASGDSDPFDKTAHGFDGISQSALFAGADSSFFIHQQLPLVLDQLNLKVRDSLFPDLRSSAAPGQSNYDNPGLRLVGLGADFDFSPAVRLSVDANHLWFDQTATLNAIFGQRLAGRDIGTDLSFDLFYRPLDSQNIILRLTAARLLAAPDTKPLTGGDAPFSGFFNLILTY